MSIKKPSKLASFTLAIATPHLLASAAKADVPPTAAKSEIADQASSAEPAGGQTQRAMAAREILLGTLLKMSPSTKAQLGAERLAVGPVRAFIRRLNACGGTGTTPKCSAKSAAPTATTKAGSTKKAQ